MRVTGTLRTCTLALVLLCVATSALAGSDANMRKLKKLSQFMYGALAPCCETHWAGRLLPQRCCARL